MGSEDGGGAASPASPPSPRRPPDRPLRILVVTNMYPPHAYGGYELGCRDVVERWRRRGHEVLVLTSTVEVDGVSPVGSGERSRVRRDLQLYWEDHEILRPSPWRRLRAELANRAAFDRTVDEFHPDVCSAWAMGAMSLGLLARAGQRGLPVVPVVCDEWPVYGPRLDAWLRLFSADRPGTGRHARRAAGRVARVVTGLPTAPPALDSLGPACFGSRALRDAVRAASPWRFPDSAVVPWGIDASDFGPGVPLEAVADRRRSRWDWRLLVVGRIDPRKGADVAIRALARCPETATLDVVGRGDDRHRAELEALARSIGVGQRVRFDQVARHQLAARYRRADALIFPPRWAEPFGLVPLEAMACGTPVAASPTGGSTEFLVDAANAAGNCVTFASGDADGLAAALARLAGDRGLRQRLVHAGMATASRLTVDAMAEGLEEWHHEAVDRVGRGAARHARLAVHDGTTAA
jgi:glycogen(starch) synthase